MIQLFNSNDFSQFVIATLLVLLLTPDLKLISTVKDFCWHRVEKLHKLFEHHQGYDEADFDDDDDYDERPSPSQVPVPFMAHVVSDLIKTKLPVFEFGRSKLGADIGEQSSSAECAICLECIQGSEEIRELSNCSHLYHRECIDGWVDQDHETCPLCGHKLLPFEVIAVAEDKEAKGVYDPWRLDRRAYLFGESC